MKNRYPSPFFRKHFLTGVFLVPLFFASEVFAVPLFINEIHYDNAGGDTGEAVEIAGPAGSDLSGWQLVLYNGNGGGAYGAAALTGIIPNQQSGFGTLFYPILGIQNGNPDGLALIDASSAVVQFLSYGGIFTATGGPASGMTSTSIGVAESSGTPVGFSLQLGGVGSDSADFFWQNEAASTFGGVNTNQRFQIASVPEGHVSVLFALGFLGLAGIRAFCRRRFQTRDIL